MVSIQRATGYGWRKAITLEEIEECTSLVKSINPDIVTMADNCYGEFLEIKEPTQVGIDVLAGSLIKNPGGGLALTGGYIAGKENLETISYRMTSPGIGGECGLMFDQTRTMLQGLFMAPQTVNGAVKGAVLCGKVFEKLGYEVCPKAEDVRSDIIQAVKLRQPEAVVAFCEESIQAAAPIDAHVTPIPWDMPGYEDPVIMAAGAFIQGSSIELSADAPLREPYVVYFQGGLTYAHSKFGVMKALQSLYRKGLVVL